MFLLGKEKGYTLVEIIADNMIFIKNEYAHKIKISKEFQDDYLSLYIKNFIEKENRFNLSKDLCIININKSRIENYLLENFI